MFTLYITEAILSENVKGGGSEKLYKGGNGQKGGLPIKGGFKPSANYESTERPTDILPQRTRISFYKTFIYK